MIVPMLNVRKPPGSRGEALVGRMRARRVANIRRRRAMRNSGGATVPSELHASSTGTVARKRFSLPGPRRQSSRPVPFMGGLSSVRFGD